jgi:hypothetical protein
MKNTARICLITSILALTLASGCQRSRLLSRNDYAEMHHDPFMESGSSASASAGDQDPSATGVVRMDGRPTRPGGLASQRPLPSAATALAGGPKPISGNRTSRPLPGRIPVARATYPDDNPVTASLSGKSAEYPGPALSDFLGDTTDSRPAAASAPNGIKHSSADMQDFAQFVDTSTEVVPTPGSGLPIGTTESPEPDFSRWMSDQQQHWATRQSPHDLGPAVALNPRGEAFPEPSTAAGAGIVHRGASESNQMSRVLGPPTAAPDDVIDLLSGNIPMGGTNGMAGQHSPNHGTHGLGGTAALPAGQNPFSGMDDPFQAVSVAEPSDSNGQSSGENSGPGNGGTVAVEPGPFANPFATSPAESDTTAPNTVDFDVRSNDAAPTDDSLDSAFRMDGGWKPSHEVLRP